MHSFVDYVQLGALHSALHVAVVICCILVVTARVVPKISRNKINKIEKPTKIT